jgi:hypothetical protein
MGKSTPKPDPQIGQAALKSAEMGEKYLSWMQSQADITNAWAEEDRDRFQTTFQPLEDQMIADAQSYASPERKAMAAGEAVADVRQQSALGRQQQQRQMSAMGVSPASGRFEGEARRGNTAEALAAAGAGNMARRQVEMQGDAKMAGVVNMGRGMAVNPATSMGMSNQAGSSGFSGAMQGYNQQGGLLLGQHNAQMQAWNAQNQMMGGIGQGIGMLTGAFMSSEKTKTKKKKSMGVLDAVKGMRVEEWEYKAGMGDGGGRKHVGPYAEEFAAKTGLGNGREISVIDAVGVNMGATKELAAQVDKLQKKIDGTSSKKRSKAKEAA